MTWKIQIIYDRARFRVRFIIAKWSKIYFERKHCVHMDREKHTVKYYLSLCLSGRNVDSLVLFETFLYFPNFSENCI